MTLKIEAGKKYRTRGGDEAEILKTDVRGGQPVVGIVTYEDGTQLATEWEADGSYWSDHAESSHDLISEIKPKRTVWLNVYEGDDGCYFYDSREEANKQAIADEEEGAVRIACIRVEFEKGQFDE